MSSGFTRKIDSRSCGPRDSRLPPNSGRLEGRINTRILKSDPKAQDKEDSRNHALQHPRVCIAYTI